MALISCQECNAPVSSEATSCPSCGYPAHKQEVERFKVPPRSFGIFVKDYFSQVGRIGRAGYIVRQFTDLFVWLCIYMGFFVFTHVLLDFNDEDAFITSAFLSWFGYGYTTITGNIKRLHDLSLPATHWYTPLMVTFMVIDSPHFIWPEYEHSLILIVILPMALVGVCFWGKLLFKKGNVQINLYGKTPVKFTPA